VQVVDQLGGLGRHHHLDALVGVGERALQAPTLVDRERPALRVGEEQPLTRAAEPDLVVEDGVAAADLFEGDPSAAGQVRLEGLRPRHYQAMVMLDPVAVGIERPHALSVEQHVDRLSRCPRGVSRDGDAA
jgi:hypothetical protein